MMKRADYVVVGGGLVGLSTAWQLQVARPDLSVLLIEKESSLCQHQSGHNSGVIHAGVYYQPGSLKADFCRRGAKATKQFCQQYQIPYENCGKLIVATCRDELGPLEDLARRCRLNEIEVHSIDAAELKRRSPATSGLAALWVPETGIVDYTQVGQQMARNFRQFGGQLHTDCQLNGWQESDDRIVLQTTQGRVEAGYVIVCAGLMADRMVRLAGMTPEFQIVPFRGEYFRLPSSMRDGLPHLIYPVPDPKMPFLGIHLTRMADGGLTVGPNAVLGWKREGYESVNFSMEDTLDTLRFKGFWKMLTGHIQFGLGEFKNSLWKRGYLKRVQQYAPGIRLKDMTSYPAGIRAQAVSLEGELIHDFLFQRSKRSLHVCNAPSPAATAAIPIGEHLVKQVLSSSAVSEL